MPRGLLGLGIRSRCAQGAQRCPGGYQGAVDGSQRLSGAQGATRWFGVGWCAQGAVRAVRPPAPGNCLEVCPPWRASGLLRGACGWFGVCVHTECTHRGFRVFAGQRVFLARMHTRAHAMHTQCTRSNLGCFRSSEGVLVRKCTHQTGGTVDIWGSARRCDNRGGFAFSQVRQGVTAVFAGQSGCDGGVTGV